MTPLAEQFSWFGSGWVADVPHASMWTALGIALGGGLLIVIVSYRYTLVGLAPSRRAVLCTLRLTVWIALLVILAAPTRILRVYDHPPQPRPLAVLVDRSDSMTIRDNRGFRRIDDALQTWHRIDPAARKTFESVKTYDFATGMSPVSGVTDVAHLPGGRTDLFASLQSALAHAPSGGWGAIVTLTDGLDTSGIDISKAADATARTALKENTPLYFIAGHNRTTEPPFFRIRDFTAPAEIQPHTIISLQALFDSYQTRASSLDAEFTADGNAQQSSILSLDPGPRMETWSGTYAAEIPGAIVLQLRAGNQIARREVRVRLPDSNRILYEVGSLDWNYRYLASILRRGGNFSVTPVYSFPQQGVELPPTAVEGLRLTSDVLRDYAVVILDDLAPNRMSTDEQAALSQWVSDGGIVLFLTPDQRTAQSYSGSELEKMLPVVFPQKDSAEPAADGGYPLNLLSFVWDDPAKARDIVGGSPDANLEEETPRFAGFTRIERSKPGAVVLARHPTALGPDGLHAILLAVEQYGRGRSAVLATDALWRWKLSQPSGERGVQVFWENFLSWLCRNRQPDLRFDHPPVRTATGRDADLRVSGATEGALKLEASLGDRHIPLAEQAPDGGSRIFLWRPNAAGLWRIEATDSTGQTSHAWVSAFDPPKMGEMSGAPPDDELLRSLAERTSGSLLQDIPAAWTAKPPSPHLLSVRREPLWHQPWILVALVCAYGLEMILRRRWQLL